MPDGAAGGQRADLVEQLRVGRRRHQGDHRRPPRDEGDRLVGVEGRGGDEVVVVPLQALDHVVDQGPVGLRGAVEGGADRLGGSARVGRRALHEEDVDARPGPPPLRGDRVDGGRHLVRGVPGAGGGAQRAPRRGRPARPSSCAPVGGPRPASPRRAG